MFAAFQGKESNMGKTNRQSNHRREFAKFQKAISGLPDLDKNVIQANILDYQYDEYKEEKERVEHFLNSLKR